MTTLHPLDDISGIKLAAYPQWAYHHLANPAHIQTDTAAIELAATTTAATAAGYRITPDGWQGLDHPTYQHIYATTAAGEGERHLHARTLARDITIPITAPPNINRQPLDQTLDPQTGPIIACWNRTTTTNASYLIACHTAGAYDRTQRGPSERAPFKIKLRSQWGYFLRPQPLNAGTHTIPAGPGRQIWGITHPNPSMTAPLTITMTGGELGTATRTWTWTPNAPGAPTLPANPERIVACYSPPFADAYILAGGTQHSASATRTNAHDMLPYLTPGQTYTLTANQAVQFWTLQNRLAP